MQERKSILPEPLRAVANMLEEIKRSQKATEARLSDHGADLEKLEAELQRQIYVQERQAKEIHRLKQELDLLKSAKPGNEAENKTAATEKRNSADDVKASEEAAPFQQQSGVRMAPFKPEDFYKTAATQGTGQHYTTASIQLGSETQTQPQDNCAPDKTVTPATTATAALPKTQNGYSQQKARNKDVPANSSPVIQGSGFSHITLDYLRSLGDK